MIRNSIIIRAPDDLHVHFRDGEMAERVAPYTMRTFARALVMPNLSPPITIVGQLQEYRARLEEIARTETPAPARMTDAPFIPLMTFYANESVDPKSVWLFKKAGAVAGKYYPRGVTTGSEAGASDIEELFPLFAAMEEHDLVLCVHGEAPGVFCLDREHAFLRDLVRLVRTFPKLRIVLEHITTANTVGIIENLPNVAATITVHHLYLTLDDIVGDKLNPHAFCKPIAKRASDRDALIAAAISGNPKFFFGSDSAPHLRGAKECASGCAGIFSAPCAMESLLEVFEEHDALDKLENFTSTFGAQFYSLPLNEGTVMYSRENWKLDDVDDFVGVVPFRAGQTMRWRRTA